jgi:uncharacterized protein (TIGR00255 family)
MLRSMTGFGAAASEEGGVRVRVEVRSVNHRHLQAKVRLPYELGHLEQEVDGAVRKRLSRGSVNVGVHLDRSGGAALVTIDEDAAARYHAELARLAKRLGTDEEPSLEAVLALPGVVESAGEQRVLALEERLCRAAVKEALASLVEMREREGEALDADLRKQAAAIAKLGGQIERRMPTVVRGHHAMLTKRANELLGDSAAVSEKDLARELAVLADRMDVSEEVVRLASHLDQIGKLLDSGGAIGRKLDFLVQELFREANTIGSKCNDAKVSHWVVDAKTRIERMREQAQNVE